MYHYTDDSINADAFIKCMHVGQTSTSTSDVTHLQTKSSTNGISPESLGPESPAAIEDQPKVLRGVGDRFEDS